jgi:hypothetical protein
MINRIYLKFSNGLMIKKVLLNGFIYTYVYTLKINKQFDFKELGL